MSEKKVKVPLPNGETVEGIEVSVENSTEPWAEVQLADGVVLRFKNVVTAGIRLVDKYDAEGNPLYLLKNAAVMSYKSVPDELRQKEKGSATQ